MKRLRYGAETILVRFFVFFFSHMPVSAASLIGGWVARMIGPRLGVTNTARNNLAWALPELSAPEREQVIIKMWDNLGRVAAEFPHVHTGDSAFIDHYVSVTGLENLLAAKDQPQGALLFSGHLGNWEILPKLAACHNIPLSSIYRPANNPAVDRVIASLRAKSRAHMLPKGVHGAKAIMTALKNGKAVAMLVDQKMNDGISVPFFGKEAMTAPALAKLALKLGCPVIPARVKRLHGVYFSVEILPPIHFTATGNNTLDCYNLMLTINAQLESWIRETPEQWFWVHKRWPKIAS